MKRLLSSITIVAILCASVSGCGSKESGGTVAGGAQKASSGSEKKVTLTIESSQAFTGTNHPIFNEANIKAFEDKYPHIKVDILLIPDAQATTTLQTKLAAGETSDIILYNRVSAENELNAAVNMLELGAEPWVSRLKNQDIIKLSDGKIYGYSAEIMTGAVGVAYNEKIFSDLNLSVPTTYDEFLAVCETLKSNGITPIYGPFKDVWTFQIFPTTGWGTIAQKLKPEVFDELNSNKLKWSEIPEFVDVLERGNNLFKKGYVQETCLADDFNGAPAAFSSGKYAMIFTGEGFITDMLEKDASLSLSMFPIPIFDDPEMNVLDQAQNNLLFIPKTAKNVEEAKLFLDFLSQPEQLENSMSDPKQAFMPNFADGPEPETLGEVKDYLYKTYIEAGKVSLEANAYLKVDLNDLWKYYQDMIGGVKTPEEVLNDWDAKFAELMQAKGIEGF